MKIKIKNLGVLRQAEYSLGALTIICGGNNTGKTYATHATYGLLDYLRTDTKLSLEDEKLSDFFRHRFISFSLDTYVVKVLRQAAISSKQDYSKILSSIFAGNEKNFVDSSIGIDFDDALPSFSTMISDFIINITGQISLSFKHSLDKKSLDVRLIGTEIRKDTELLIKEGLAEGLRKGILGEVIPEVFLASAERTGAAIFQKELDFTRNRLLEILGDKTAQIQSFPLLDRFKGEYPLAVRRNVDFIRTLSNIYNKDSVLVGQCPGILTDFQDIIGGEYKVSNDGGIYYTPLNTKKAKLSLVESSSAVRSLLDIGFYLRHLAKPGDLLMIDEPELNLHPENQRRIAKLCARLVNHGVQVFMTTHSDYIVKEFNALIMLRQEDERLQQLAKREGYRTDELLDYTKVKVYIADVDYVKLEDGQRKTRCQTLIPADISPKLGIEVKSFDTTIDDMNRVQDEIIWGT